MHERILILLAPVIAPLIFFCSLAMENPDFKILSQEWIAILHAKQKNNSSDYKEHFKSVTCRIKKQKPLKQLKIYAGMIEQSVKFSNHVLVEDLCSLFMQVYNHDFQASNNERKGFKIVRSVRKLLEEKKIYANALSKIRLASCTSALAPLSLNEPDQIVKTPRIPSTDFFYNSNAELQIATLKNSPILFDNKKPLAVWHFAEDVLVGVTRFGRILYYTYKTGECAFTSKKNIEGRPLLLTHKTEKPKNKDIERKQIEPGLYLLLAHNKRCLHCLWVDAVLVAAYSDGAMQFNGPRHSCKRKNNFHTAKITTLLALSACKMVSGSKNGEICLWNSKKKHCSKIFKTMTNKGINSLIQFNDTLFSLAGESAIELWDSKRKKSNLVYYSEDPIKALQGFNDFFIAGLKNGSLKIWHKECGFNQSALVRINPSHHLQALEIYDGKLFAFYKKGMIISFTKEYITLIFEQALSKLKRETFFNV